MDRDFCKKYYKAVKNDSHGSIPVKDAIIVEEALQININAKPYTVTMRTPGSDEALIRGLLFTEGIYSGSTQPNLKIVDHTKDGIPSSIGVWIAHDNIEEGFYQSRSMISVSSCGICGKRELSDILIDGKILSTTDKLTPAMVSNMLIVMKDKQIAFKETGGSHAAAAFDLNGVLLAIEEDIGRHNAVDKVIGDLLNTNTLEKATCMLVSGRVSFEIVSKTYKAGIPFLAAVSSPSSLSIETADAMGITLMAFCRDRALTCYSHSDRIITNNIQVLTP